MLQNRCDVHTHTLFSRHAYSTVRENVLAARDAGLELLGITDHFSDMLFPGAGLEHADMRDYQHFLNTTVWPRTWEGVRLLRGAEADLRALDGRLYGQDIPVTEEITGAPVRKEATLYDRVVANCDYVIASVHLRDFVHDATVDRTTEMYVRALSQPKVLVIGHAGRAGVPFDVREVVARIKATFRRLEKTNDAPPARSELQLHFAGLTVTPSTMTVEKNGRAVDLTPLEYQLLMYFYENRNVALSREKILGAVWGYDYFGNTRTVDIHVLRLRKKLGLDNEIRTIFKIGYIFEIQETV